MSILTKDGTPAANKKLNTVADKAVDADNGQDALAGKQVNTVAEPLMLIKN